MFRWVRLYLHQTLNCRKIPFNRLPEHIPYVVLVQVWHTSLPHVLLSTNVYSSVKDPGQNITYDHAFFAHKMMSHLHRNLHASEITQLRLHCPSLTHCPVKVEIFGSDTSKCLAVGVASSFTRHRLGHFSSISTPPSSQHFPSTLTPLLSLKAFNSRLPLSCCSIIKYTYLLNQYGVGHH